MNVFFLRWKQFLCVMYNKSCILPTCIDFILQVLSHKVCIMLLIYTKTTHQKIINLFIWGFTWQATTSFPTCGREANPDPRRGR